MIPQTVKSDFNLELECLAREIIAHETGNAEPPTPEKAEEPASGWGRGLKARLSALFTAKPQIKAIRNKLREIQLLRSKIPKTPDQYATEPADRIAHFRQRATVIANEESLVATQLELLSALHQLIDEKRSYPGYSKLEGRIKSLETHFQERERVEG